MEHPTKESLSIEFKSDKKCYPLGKLYEDLVAMANTDGGCLFLGVEDNGTPTGVNLQHKNCQQMEASIQDNTSVVCADSAKSSQRKYLHRPQAKLLCH